MQAILSGPEGLYLAGVPTGDLGSLKAAIADWDYLYPAKAWLPTIQTVLPNRFMIAHERIRMTLGTKPGPHRDPPGGFELTATGQPMEFSIVHDDKIVSRCSLDMRTAGYAEFGIWTHPDFRGRGLAKIAACASVACAFDQGITTVGWHCHVSNTRSAKVAAALGFTVTDRYRAYSASLPAENEGDLSSARLEELGAHFAGGAAEIPWLNFHAAAAWAQAGHDERALQAIESLVAGGWTGEAEWLEEHWAFAKLTANPRFRQAILQQRAAV
jgi:GNAT superfamily N-acetyltransferase